MNPTNRRRSTRIAAALLLAIGLACTAAPAARAQDPNAPVEGGDTSGRPLDGYLGMLCLATFALIVIGKTARRG